MLKIGLTGNIGSGKTTVARIFKILGVPVYYADDEAKKFLYKTEVAQVLIRKFGDSILTESNIDRKKLAKFVFSDTSSLQFLNNLIQPLIKTDFDNWVSLQSADCKYVIQEAAILFESGFDKYVDKIILVAAPENIRLERVISRDKIQKEEVIKRMNNQWAEERKSTLSDYIIINDEVHLVVPQILEIHNKIISNTV